MTPTLVPYGCPKCGATTRQRDDATEVSHLCKPFHRQATRMVKVPIVPQGDDGNTKAESIKQP